MSRSTVYNKIVTDELLAQVNKENMELMDEWVDYLSSVDRSPRTIKQYINNLKIFWVWNLQHNKNKFFVKFSKRDMTKYQNYLLTVLGHSSARVKVLRATLSSLSQYIENILDEEEGFEGFKNIINKVESPKGEAVREKTVISEEEMTILLDKLVEEGQYQIACSVALGAFSGSRKSELTRFKVNYFDKECISMGLYKTPEKITSKGRGSKGKMIHKYTLVNLFDKYLELWINQREELGIDSEWLFISKEGSEYVQAKITTLDSWTNRVEKCLGKPFYYHSLRHYYTTMLVKAGIPAEVIKKISSWSSVTMVSTYTDLTLEDEIGNFFGDEGIIKQEEKGLNNL